MMRSSGIMTCLRSMKRGLIGRYVPVPFAAGESARAFVLNPSPPVAPAGLRLRNSRTRREGRGGLVNRRRKIPTGFRPPAQGCEERATLGHRETNFPTATRLWQFRFRLARVTLAPTPLGLCLRMFSQGSSHLATLGFGTESRWDSR